MADKTSTATPGAGNKTVAFASKAIKKTPGYPSTANCSTCFRILNTYNVIAMTANNASTLRRLVKNPVFFLWLAEEVVEVERSGDWLACCVSVFPPLEVTREERTDDVRFFCALCFVLDVSGLVAFFDGDTFNFYCRGIDVARITGRDGYEHIHSIYDLPEDGVTVIQMRGGTVSNKKL